MCFTYEEAFSAEVFAETDGPSPWPGRCGECRNRIHPGEWRRHVLVREYEECRRCQDEGTVDYAPDHPECEAGAKCDFGRTWEGDVCERCHALREAVKAVELAEGCAEAEATPAYGTMYEDVANGSGWAHYADAMRRLGLHAAAALVPPPDPRHLFEALAYPGGHGCPWAARPAGPYAGAVDPGGRAYDGWQDLGGEG